jgi:hypothetical protein
MKLTTATALAVILLTLPGIQTTNGAETASGTPLIEQGAGDDSVYAANTRRKRQKSFVFKRQNTAKFQPPKRRQGLNLTSGTSSPELCNQSGTGNCQIDTFEKQCDANDGVLETQPGGGIECNTDHWD